jgi:S1-C subfamily serine protease
MHLRTSTLFWGFPFIIAVLCGCASASKPSAEARHASYAKIQNLFAGDREAALCQAYVVLSGDSKAEIPDFAAGATSGYFSGTNKMNLTTQGMAIGLSADGYLLTASHIVGAKNWVLGCIDGRIDCRPARLVFRSGSATPTDVALIKVEGKLGHCASFGKTPQVGDTVFGVVCYRKGTEPGGCIDFTGGKVLSIRDGPGGSSVTLVDTDVPQWLGDSGGPLLSNSGQLVGVFSLYHYYWAGHWRRWTTCFLPNPGFVQDVITADRALVDGANPQGGANGRQPFGSDTNSTPAAAASRRSP